MGTLINGCMSAVGSLPLAKMLSIHLVYCWYIVYACRYGHVITVENKCYTLSNGGLKTEPKHRHHMPPNKQTALV